MGNLDGYKVYLRHYMKASSETIMYGIHEGVDSKKTFRKYGRRVDVKPYIHEIPEIEARGIDYPEDFD